MGTAGEPVLAAAEESNPADGMPGVPVQWNPTAMAELHRTEFNGLVRFMLLNGASWSEAQDAAQDAFAALCRTNSHVQSPRTWLRTVALRMWGRSRVPEFPSGLSAADEQMSAWETPAQAMEISAGVRDLMEILLQLPPKQRAVMAWRSDGYSIGEISSFMQISKDAVRQNLARARAAMKPKIDTSLRGSSHER